MKFKVNKHYDLFGYNVVLINDPKFDLPKFRIYKKAFGSCINVHVDQKFLKNMDSIEIRKLELLFKDLENYAKFNDISNQEDNK